MNEFKDHLWSDLVREHGTTLAQLDRSRPRGANLHHPRVLAGGTLGLAGIVAVLVLALGGSTATPAFAVTKNDDGSVLVKLNSDGNENLPQLNAELAAMGIDEDVEITMAPGPASVPGPVDCKVGPRAKTPVEVLVGDNGTETIVPGQSTVEEGAEGSFHLDRCVVTVNSDAGELR